MRNLELKCEATAEVDGSPKIFRRKKFLMQSSDIEYLKRELAVNRVDGIGK